MIPTRSMTQAALAAGYWLRPTRIADVPGLAAAIAGSALRRSRGVPSLNDIASRPAGFAGLAFDTSTPTVLAAARAGFYPYSHVGPMGWWNPPRRGVMMLTEVHLPKRFRRTARKTTFAVTIDHAFDAVLEGCAAPRPGRPQLTWLTPAARALYGRLHREGHAHSVEVWDGGELVGGVFGLDVAPVFSALSMFHTRDDASKLAIASLYHHLDAWDYLAVDHQTLSPWVRDLGGTELTREDYVALLAGPAPTVRAPWTECFSPAQTGAWEPSGAVPDAA